VGWIESRKVKGKRIEIGRMEVESEQKAGKSDKKIGRKRSWKTTITLILSFTA
jgi:hypothetical protein